MSKPIDLEQASFDLVRAWPIVVAVRELGLRLGLILNGMTAGVGTETLVGTERLVGTETLADPLTDALPPAASVWSGGAVAI